VRRKAALSVARAVAKVRGVNLTRLRGRSRFGAAKARL
jgi:hypothetical protein